MISCHNKRIILTASLALFTFTTSAQNYSTSLLKVGGFVYLLHGSYNGFSAHLEHEKALRKAEFLTIGPRIDYTNFEYSFGDLMLAYNLKLYPFYGVKKKVYDGPFIGVDVAYLARSNDVNISRFGPGIGPIAGYQHRFKKFSISLEAGMIYVKDLNEKARQHNPSHIYLYPFACIKGGLTLQKPKP